MKTRAPRPEPLTTDEPVPGDPRSEFGKKLRAARIRAGLTHAEVAEQAGLTQQYVSVVEGGRQNITLSTMIALARVTGHEGEGRAPESTPAAGGGDAEERTCRIRQMENPGGGNTGFSDKATDAGDSDRPETSDNTHR